MVNTLQSALKRLYARWGRIAAWGCCACYKRYGYRCPAIETVFVVSASSAETERMIPKFLLILRVAEIVPELDGFSGVPRSRVSPC